MGKLQRWPATCLMLKFFHSIYGEKPYTLLCIFSIELIQHVLVGTPYEIWHGTKVVVSHYRVFDYFAYVFINKQRHSKLDAKSSKLVFVGYNTTSKGYKLWEPNTKKVKESAHVTFDETSAYDSFAPKPAHLSKLLQVGV